MKKQIIMVAMLATALVACNSNESDQPSILQPAPEVQNVAFGFRYTGEGRAMTTKAEIPTADAQSIISKLSVTATELRNDLLDLKSLDGLTPASQVQFGRSYSLPYGMYNIKYHFERSGGYLDNDVHAMFSPSFVIDDTIHITKGTDNCILNAQYDCFAVIWDKNRLSVCMNGKGVSNSLCSSISPEYDCLFIKPVRDDFKLVFDIASTANNVHLELTAEDVRNGMFYELKDDPRNAIAEFSLYYEDFQRGTWW